MQLSATYYERRSAIISGKSAPTADGIAAGEEESKKNNEDYEALPSDSSDTAPIKSFWLTALHNHPVLDELITDRDVEALSHLEDIKLNYISGTKQEGYKLSFYFSPNEVFEDSVLEKSYFFKEDIDWEGNLIYDRAVGTTIKWKEGKDLTKEVEVKKQRNKSKNITSCFLLYYLTD